MISYQEAQQILQQQARSFGREQLSLDQAYGRVLTETVRADRDYPPFDRATMDGYAIRYKDLENGIRRYTIAETVYAGAAATKPIHTGECYKIMTGAPVPEGVDIVIRREETNEAAGSMEMRTEASNRPPDWRPFLNIARKGEDMQGGEIVIDRSCLCEAPVIGLLASLGKKELLVETLPRVVVLTTGNEVVPVESPVADVQIRNSNRWLLQSLLKGEGIDVSLFEHATDHRQVLRDKVRSVLSCDLLILSGGVSAGDADYVPEILEELGVKKLFHKLAIRPGKPVWCGVTPNGTIVFALPGNPLSCLVNFVLLIRPYLQACFGLGLPPLTSLPLASFKKKKTPLDEFFPVRLQGTPGRLLQAPVNGSGDIRHGREANALALHPADSGDLEEGAYVLYFPA